MVIGKGEGSYLAVFLEGKNHHTENVLNQSVAFLKLKLSLKTSVFLF